MSEVIFLLLSLLVLGGTVISAFKVAAKYRWIFASFAGAATVLIAAMAARTPLEGDVVSTSSPSSDIGFLLLIFFIAALVIGSIGLMFGYAVSRIIHGARNHA